MSEALVKIGALRKALADYDAIRTPGTVLDGDAEAVITAAAEALDVLDASLRGGAAIEATLRASLLAAERERDATRAALAGLEVYAGHLVAPVEGCTCGSSGVPAHMPGCGIEPIAVMAELPGARDWLLAEVARVLDALQNAESEVKG